MDLLRVNWRTMAEFEILYKVLSLTIFTPLFLWAFNGIMKVSKNTERSTPIKI